MHAQRCQHAKKLRAVKQGPRGRPCCPRGAGRRVHDCRPASTAMRAAASAARRPAPPPHARRRRPAPRAHCLSGPRLCPCPCSGPRAPAAGGGQGAGDVKAVRAQLELMEQDCARVSAPDWTTPFADLEDAVDRLLPYHVSCLRLQWPVCKQHGSALLGARAPLLLAPFCRWAARPHARLPPPHAAAARRCPACAAAPLPTPAALPPCRLLPADVWG